MSKKFNPYFCKEAFVDVVLPTSDIKLDGTGKWLTIGYPGVDGIEFRTKTNENDQEIYAFYPIEERYTRIADSPDDLVEKWKANVIKL